MRIKLIPVKKGTGKYSFVPKKTTKLKLKRHRNPNKWA